MLVMRLAELIVVNPNPGPAAEGGRAAPAAGLGWARLREEKLEMNHRSFVFCFSALGNPVLAVQIAWHRFRMLALDIHPHAIQRRRCKLCNRQRLRVHCQQ